MADLKTLVEREMDRAGEPTFAFEDLDGLRVRRHRRNRIAATAVGLGVLLILALVGASIYRSTPHVPAAPPAALPSPTWWFSLPPLRGDGPDPQGPPEPVASASISPDGSRVAFAAPDGQ